MFVLGIVGSPRKDGRTNKLMGAALDGAQSRGAEAKKVYLIDYEIRPHLGVNPDRRPYCASALSDLCEEADAVVVGAPVYYGDINGITKSFMDTVRIANANGKLALGYAIAGGSGKGLLSGVQSIYHFFYHRQMRGVDPTPVTRFNMEAAIASLRVSGAKLVNLHDSTGPFPGERREDRWGSVLAHYATLKVMEKGPFDEFVMLAEQLIALSEGEQAAEAQAELDAALTLITAGKRSEAALHAVRAYDLLYFPG